MRYENDHLYHLRREMRLRVVSLVVQEEVVNIVKLPLGKQAPLDADCIRIEEQSRAEFKLTGSALYGTGDGGSVTVGETSLFATAEQAEAAGTAWASEVGVERLFVSTGTLECPLEMLELDKPL